MWLTESDSDSVCKRFVNDSHVCLDIVSLNCVCAGLHHAKLHVA